MTLWERVKRILRPASEAPMLDEIDRRPVIARKWNREDDLALADKIERSGGNPAAVAALRGTKPDAARIADRMAKASRKAAEGRDANR